jgi:hypothetical protein
MEDLPSGVPQTWRKESSIYPLVNVYIAIENGHRNSEFSHEKCNFP